MKTYYFRPGDSSLLHIEAAHGHFKLIAYCQDESLGNAHDDCDAICRLTREGLIVYGNRLSHSSS